MAETNPTTHFLYKAIFVSIFLLLLPLFPSDNTTTWELLQLVFVGIAVSYGLFSKRTNDEEVKPDNAHSYVTRLLQVSSVFDDDDDESNLILQENNNNNSKVVETWSSQYYRGEPIVVVANETTSDDATIEKPVVCVSESRRSRGPQEEENIVLRSPIPWRSRSGKMELKSLEDSDINESQSLSFRYQSSTNPEIQLQDFGRKNKSPIPPPPPPPPPPPAQQKLNYYYRQSSSRMKKEFTRSLTNEDLQKQKRARMRNGFTSSSSSKSFRIPRETEYDEYLSHDKEIESFIQTRRGSQKKTESNTQTQPPIEMMIEDSDDELVELASKNNTNVDDHGPDVDKKADEFIAKFREQIRLQRIASIRRSTSQT